MYCQHDNVDLCDMNEIMSMLVQVRKEFKQSVPIKGIELMALHKKMWRYLAMIDPQVDRYMSRDTDSEIFEREVAAVDEWLRSDRTFHVMRDHQGHLAEIMGGNFIYFYFQLCRCLFSNEMLTIAFGALDST